MLLGCSYKSGRHSERWWRAHVGLYKSLVCVGEVQSRTVFRCQVKACGEPWPGLHSSVLILHRRDKEPVLLLWEHRRPGWQLLPTRQPLRFISQEVAGSHSCKLSLETMNSGHGRCGSACHNVHGETTVKQSSLDHAGW